MYMLICCLSILWLSLYCCTLTRKNRLCLYCKAFYYKTTSFVIILGKYVCLFSKVRSNCVCVLACVRACVCVWFSLMSNNVKLSFNFQRSCKSSIFFEQHLCGHQQRSNILLNTTSTCMNAICRNIYIWSEYWGTYQVSTPSIYTPTVFCQPVLISAVQQHN